MEMESQKDDYKFQINNFVQLFSTFNFDFYLIDKFSLENAFTKRMGLFENFNAEQLEINYLDQNRILFHQKGNNILGIRTTNEEKQVQIKETQIAIQTVSISYKYK
jgi:hypothetical protein